MKNSFSKDVRICPKCGSTKGMRIINTASRCKEKWLYRTRECQFCGETIGTYEISVVELKKIREENKGIKRGLIEVAKVIEEYGFEIDEDD